ncbi:hypothetical protein [Microbacterium murale]|uniref:Uncharacterized protein n=1 Tax=Microbacterium murale TaxID=1081040 RepID=A0ABQ1RRE4_9MICO|nr:hypothetical protein [Microbacterium murale]GGD76525.1 hypothetical protein GCM10007269_19360 [Microbacterium murale]
MTDDAPEPRRIRLNGERFDGGRLPIDSLPEISKYQEVVRLIARAEWEEDHPGEQVPPDFDESLRLAISDLRDGSADVFVVFEQHAQYQTYQAEADEMANETIAAAYSGEALPPLPASVEYDARDLIAQIGGTLSSESDSIEFYVNGVNAAPVRIDVVTRLEARDILLTQDFLVDSQPVSTAPKDDKRADAIVGRITVIDAEKMTFILRTPDGKDLKARYVGNPVVLEDIRALVHPEAEGPVTRVSGLLHSKAGEPWRFWTTDKVEQLTFEGPWAPLLTELASLRTDWSDEGASYPIGFDVLDATQTLLSAVDLASDSNPAVFPSIPGGVLVEWVGDRGVRSIEITADLKFELFSIDRGQREGDFTETSSITDVLTFVREVSA